jgi:hypothetical protein
MMGAVSRLQASRQEVPMSIRAIVPISQLLASLLVLACSQDSQAPLQPTATSAGDVAATAIAAVAALPAGTVSKLPPFNPGNFVKGVTNRLFPLPLGRRLVYKGTEDGEPEKVITDVTRNHKTILGVPVVEVLDRVFRSGELAEKTFDWYAQDKQGNVWYFGEDTKEFEDGKVVSTEGSFEAGKHGARAGIIMRAHPVLYQITPQEEAPGVAEDKARVIGLDATILTPYRRFEHCLKQAEFTDLEPDAVEYKFYCPGFGSVRERDIRGGTAQVKLTAVEQR